METGTGGGKLCAQTTSHFRMQTTLLLPGRRIYYDAPLNNQFINARKIKFDKK